MGVQQVKWNDYPEVQPVVTYFSYDYIQRFGGLAIEMDKDALDYSFYKVTQTHFESNVLG